MLEERVAELVAVLMVASVLAVAVKATPVPYAVALALAGLAAGIAIGPGGLSLELTPGLILFVLLPGLLFEAAFRLRWRELRPNLPAVLILATLGVLVTTAVVALLGHWALALSVPLAILLGAMIAPTDPVSVVAVFRRLLVPERLLNLIEAESLANDGTGVVVFTIALAGSLSGSISPGPAVLDFLRLSLGGVGLGLAVGYALSFVTSRIDDVQIEITLTAIAAYGGYLAGDLLHVSGILAVVAAGLVIGNHGRDRGMSESTRRAVDGFWDYLAFVLNSLIFLLIGLAVPWHDLIANLGPVLAGAGIALLARAVTVYALVGALRPLGRGVSLGWQHLLVWGGLRGAIAVALVLSLTQAGPEFALVRALVYGVTLVSIVVQGITIGPLTRLMVRVPQGRSGALP
jgi:CPA1 family monovalent cation:H+ antiporter